MQIVNAAAHMTVNLGMIKKVMMLARVLRMFRLLRHLRVSEGVGCLSQVSFWPGRDAVNAVDNDHFNVLREPVQSNAKLPCLFCRVFRCCSPPSSSPCRRCGMVSLHAAVEPHTSC